MCVGVGSDGELSVLLFLLIYLKSFALCLLATVWTVANKMYLSGIVEPVSVLLMPLTEAMKVVCGASRNYIKFDKISKVPTICLLCSVS